MCVCACVYSAHWRGSLCVLTRRVYVNFLTTACSVIDSFFFIFTSLWFVHSTSVNVMITEICRTEIVPGTELSNISCYKSNNIVLIGYTMPISFCVGRHLVSGPGLRNLCASLLWRHSVLAWYGDVFIL